MAEKMLVVKGGDADRRHGPPARRECRHRHRERPLQSVGRSGEVPIPPDAQILDVTGKTVLPGFIDGHGHLEDFHGELYLHLGITTCIYDRGLPGRRMEPGAEARHRARPIRGPRILTSGRAIGGARTETDAPGRQRTSRGNITVTTPRRHEGHPAEEGARLRPHQAQRIPAVRSGEGRRRRGPRLRSCR